MEEKPISNNIEEKPKFNWPQLICSLLIIIYLLVRIFSTEKQHSLTNGELVLFGVVLLFNSDIIKRLLALNISKDGVEVKLNEMKELRKSQEGLEENQKTQGLNIQNLASFLIHNLITNDERKHLVKLQNNQAKNYSLPPWTETEIRRLSSLGFIEKVVSDEDITKPGWFSLKELAERTKKESIKVDLNDYYKITNKGIEYLNLLTDFPDVKVESLNRVKAI